MYCRQKVVVFISLVKLSKEILNLSNFQNKIFIACCISPHRMCSESASANSKQLLSIVLSLSSTHCRKVGHNILQSASKASLWARATRFHPFPFMMFSAVFFPNTPLSSRMSLSPESARCCPMTFEKFAHESHPRE